MLVSRSLSQLLFSIPTRPRSELFARQLCDAFLRLLRQDVAPPLQLFSSPSLQLRDVPSLLHDPLPALLPVDGQGRQLPVALFLRLRDAPEPQPQASPFPLELLSPFLQPLDELALLHAFVHAELPRTFPSPGLRGEEVLRRLLRIRG